MSKPTKDSNNDSDGNDVADTASANANIVTTKADPSFPEQEPKVKENHIAPIQKLPVEILSIIFEICSKADWRLPYKIAHVSSFWRKVVCSTPAAWVLVDLQLDPPLLMVQCYLNRSRPRPVHLAAPYHDGYETEYEGGRHYHEEEEEETYWERSFRFINSHADRFVCLTASADLLDCTTFPNLRSLRTRQGEKPPPFFEFLASRYPALRHLEGTFRPSQISGQPLANIQQLCITPDEDGVWKDCLIHLSSSLVSLQVEINFHGPGPSAHVFELPHLRYLKLHADVLCYAQWIFKANAPSLKTYLPLRPLGGHPNYAVDVGQVSHLVTMTPGLIPISRFKSLQYLRLGFDPAEVIKVLEENGNLCPSLSLIEYWNSPAGDSDSGRPQIQQPVTATITRDHLGTISKVLVVHLPSDGLWQMELPDDLDRGCGGGAHCWD